MDWNSDGAKDLVTGEYYGHIHVYLNTGTDAAPVFNYGAMGYFIVPVDGSSWSAGAQSKPDVVDWNNDGKLDVLCGGVDGNVHLLINTSAGTDPSFSTAALIADGARALDVGSFSHPVAIDWDADGNKDLIVGAGDGKLHFFHNVGTDAIPAFNGSLILEAAGSPLTVGAFSAPEVSDWNGDGQADLLIGNEDGKMYFVEAVGDWLPFLLLTGAAVNDVTGDGDGEFDRGEALLLRISLSNKQAEAHNVMATVSCDSPALTVQPATASFGTIGRGQVARNALVPFCVTVAHDAPLSQTHRFRVNISYDTRTESRQRNFTIGDYASDPSAPFAWVNTSSGTVVSLGDDDNVAVSLPFSFPYYGNTYNTVYIVSNGYLALGGPEYSLSNVSIPDSAGPNAIIAPFWDDLNPASVGIVRHHLLGSAPNRFWVVEWNGVPPYGQTGSRTFQVILAEDGRIKFQYGELTGFQAQGDSATVGIESPDGTLGVQHSHNTPNAVFDGLAITFAVTSGSEDVDGDGMPDDVEEFYFGGTNEQGTADTDLDGMNNTDELRCGTDPSLAGSVLCVENASRLSSNAVEVLWQSVPSRQYNVEGRSKLTDSAWGTLNTIPLAGGDTGTGCYTATVTSAQAPYFLRVQLVH